MSNQGKKVKTHYRGTLDDGTHVWLNARTKLTLEPNSTHPMTAANRWSLSAAPVR